MSRSIHHPNLGGLLFFSLVFSFFFPYNRATPMTRRPFNSAFHGDLNMTHAIRRHVFDGHIGDGEWDLKSLAHRWTRFSGY